MKFFTYCKQQFWLSLSLGLFIIAAIYINPLREGAISDDWSYALTVKHLVETGSYKLNDWAAANIVFPAFWAYLFTIFGGYSYATLRISILFLAFIGLIVFYYFAKEHRFNSTQAGLLTLCLVSSPLLLFFSYTFMSDIPFITLLLLALLLYTRGLRLRNYFLLLLGSVIATACELTRPTGLALLGGLACVWLFNKERKARLPLFLTGTIIPGIVGIIVVIDFLKPSLVSQLNKEGQVQYFANTTEMLGDSFLWRPTTFLHYLALFTLPLVALALLGFFWQIKKPTISLLKNKPTNSTYVLGWAIIIYIFAGLAYSLVAKGVIFVPFYGWHLGIITVLGFIPYILLSLFILAGAIIFAHIFIRRYIGVQGWKTVPLHEQLLDYVTLFLLLYFLLFYQVGDRYLLVLLPFCLIVVGRRLAPWLIQFKTLTFLATLVTLIAFSIWTRSYLARTEAYWNMGEQARLAGISPNDISGTSWTWYAYYKFDDYLVETNYRTLDPQQFFKYWSDIQEKLNPYLISESEDPLQDKEWQLSSQIEYKDGLFQDKYVRLFKRTAKVAGIT